MTAIHDDESLAATLRDIEGTLIAQVPARVRESQVSGQAYALILCYIDTTTDELTPYGIVSLETARGHALKEYPEDASSYIWSPHQAFSPPERLPQIMLRDDAQLRATCHACYDYLCQDWGGRPEEEVLRPFREMMHRVARALNRLDWHDYLQPTDDFVVIASDWTGYWVDEDAAASLLPHQRSLLESRQLFFNGPAIQSVTAAVDKIGSFKNEIEAKPLDAQIRYWIGQLRSLIQEDPCEVTRVGSDSGLPLGCLQEIGRPAVVPLLELVEQQMDSQRGHRDTMRFRLLLTVREIGHADRDVHRRLRKLLEASCRANAGQPIWQTTPFHCAMCLHELFPGYPKPALAGNNVLVDYEAFLSAPWPRNE